MAAAVILATLLVLAIIAFALNRTSRGGRPVNGTHTGLRGASLDLDRPGDQIGDVVFGTSARVPRLGPRLPQSEGAGSRECERPGLRIGSQQGSTGWPPRHRLTSLSP